MATIFVWYPKARNVGHSALALDSGTYVSWWPEGEKSGVGTSNAASLSISLDKKAEGGKGMPPKIPDYASAPIKDLDEDEISKWWLKLSKRNSVETHDVRQQANRIVNGGYNMAKKNCSDLVLQALIKGGMYSKYPITKTMRNNIIATPLYIRDLGEAMTGSTGNKIQAVLTNSDPKAATLIRGMQYFFKIGI